jgi:hypothetical protein
VTGTVTYSAVGGNMVATIATTSLGVGQHVITAAYTSSTLNFNSTSSGPANAAPTAIITGPLAGALNPVNTAFTFTGTVADSNASTPTAAWTFDTVSTMAAVAGGAISTSRSFASAGVYSVTLTGNDNAGGITIVNKNVDLNEIVVVYDPNAGFVTGGGWINSGEGSYVAKPALTGKASFGFVSKYQNGANKPSGETEFNFQVANFSFHSSSYDWLVVSGARAQFKGSGAINGVTGYGFLLTALDGDAQGGGGADGFRIKITNTATGDLVYDNRLGQDESANNTQAIGGGSVVLHTK